MASVEDNLTSVIHFGPLHKVLSIVSRTDFSVFFTTYNLKGPYKTLVIVDR